MGDSALVLTSMTWLVANALLLSFLGFGDYQFEIPTDPACAAGGQSSPCRQTGGNATSSTTSGFKTFLCVGGTLAGGIVGGAGAALLSFGTLAVVGATAGGLLAGSLIGGCSLPVRIAQIVLGLVDYAINLFGFLFQLLTFSIPRIPIIMNAVIVIPPGIALGYVGLKTIRGAGG